MFGVIVPLFAAIVLLSGSSVASANDLWTQPSSGGAWGTAGNWSAGIPNATDLTADFSTLTLGSNNTVHLDGSYTVGNLVFGDVGNTFAWTLDNYGIAANVLTLNVSSGTPTITVNNQTATISAFLTGTQGLAKAGNGALVLSGANTYTNGATISAGIVNVQNASSLGGATGGNLSIAGGGELDLLTTLSNPNSATATIAGTGAIGGSGGAISSLSGNNTFAEAVSLSGNATINNAVAGTTLTLTGGVNTNGNTLTIGGAGNVTFSGTASAIVGTLGGLTYNGTGTLTMNTQASNSFTGNMTINSGIVFVASDARLGGTSNTVIINGGTLEDNGATLVATRTIALGPSSGTGGGTISMSGGTATISSPIVNNGASNSSLFINVFGTSASGAVALNETAGLNTYSGGTFVQFGTLQTNVNNTLPSTTAVSVANGATFNLNGHSQSVGSLAGAGTVNNSTGTSTLTFGNGNASGTFYGSFTNTSGTLSLAKTGTGTETFLGGSTFSGTTAIGAGIMNIQNSAALGASTGLTIAASAELDLAGSISVSSTTAITSITGTGAAGGSGGALASVAGSNTLAGAISLAGPTTIVAAANTGLSLTGAITNNANLLTVSGAGNVSISSLGASGGGLTYSGTGTTYSGAGTLFLPNSNSYSGATIVNGGTVNIGAAGSLGAGATTVTLTLNGTAAAPATLQDTIGTISLSRNIVLGSNTAASGGTLDVSFIAALSGLTLTGKISDSASPPAGGNSLTVNDIGQVVLANTTTSPSGANTFTGNTTINGGTLALSYNSAALNIQKISPTGTLILGGTLVLSPFLNTTAGTTQTLGAATALSANYGSTILQIGSVVAADKPAIFTLTTGGNTITNNSGSTLNIVTASGSVVSNVQYIVGASQTNAGGDATGASILGGWATVTYGVGGVATTDWATVNNTLNTAPYVSGTPYVVAFANYTPLPTSIGTSTVHRLLARIRRRHATQPVARNQRHQFIKACRRDHNARPQRQRPASRRHRQSLRRRPRRRHQQQHRHHHRHRRRREHLGRFDEQRTRFLHGREQHAEVGRSDHQDRHLGRGRQRHTQFGRQ